MAELILVRHGETDSNRKGAYLGWTDVELNETGIKQAYCVKEKLKGESIDAIYSSPLKRALKTAEIINENFKLEINIVDELKEHNFGGWENLTISEIKERFSEEYEMLTKDWINHPIAGGESAIQVYHRVKGFIDNLLSSNNSGKYLIVTHLGCIRYIIVHLLGMGIEGIWRFNVGNCGITRIKINREGYAYLTLLNG